MVQHFVNHVGAGYLIEFMQEKEPQLAWVLEEVQNKFRILLPNRKEINIQSSRILPWIGPNYRNIESKDIAIAHIEQHKLKRKELESSFNSYELWEIAQGEIIQAPAKWFSELVMTSPDIDTIAACAHVLLKDNIHFKFQSPNFEIYSKELVDIRVKEQEKTIKQQAFIADSILFLRYLWDLYTQKKVYARNTANVYTQFEEQLRQIIMEQISSPEKADSQLWKKLVTGLPDDPFLALYLAQAWGIVQPHHNIWFDRIDYDPTDNWQRPFQNTIDMLCKQSSLYTTPTLSLPFISIDSETTKDRDDAFFIEPIDNGWKVIVALACPALNWPFDDPLDQAVRKRATSIYLPEASYNMLPNILGVDKCSLHAQCTRPVLIITCIVDYDGIVKSCTPSFESVSLAANLTYHECEYILNDNHSEDSPYAEQLKLAFHVAQIYQKYRLKHGAVIVERSEPYLSLIVEDNETKVVLTEESATPKSHLLVSEIMILINAAIANWSYENNISLFYRTQDIIIPDQYKGIWKEPHSIAKVVKVLAPSVLDVVPKKHAGIGEKCYAPSTSPLRRYPDMVNQAQILHVLQHEKHKWSLKELEIMLPYITSRLEYTNQIQRFRQRYWKLVYILQQDKNTWWSAIVTDVTEHYIVVNLPREQITLRARRKLFTTAPEIGQSIYIRIGNIQPLHNEIHILEVQQV